MKKSVLLFIALTVIPAGLSAQDRIEATVSADLVSQYVWRGFSLGGASLQPTLGASYKGFSLSAWGSTGITDPADTRELDLTADYTSGGFSAGITDYWFDYGPAFPEMYFDYRSASTNHVFEAYAGYDFGPVSVQWFTNFAGADGVTGAGKRAYSSYFEIAAPFSTGDIEWNAAAGFVPWGTDFYGNYSFAITNLSLTATKSISLSDSFALPVFAALSVNPCTNKAYLVFGLTL